MVGQGMSRPAVGQTRAAKGVGMTHQNLLERLVENAMDFLSQSIREFEGQPNTRSFTSTRPSNYS